MNERKFAGLDKLWQAGLLVGIVGLGASAAGYFSNKEQFLQSYMFGFIFWILLTLGCLGFTMLHHTIRGAWGLSVLRITEAGGSIGSFLLMAVLFVPILMNMHGLYEWTHAEVVATDPVLKLKQGYLNEPFFIARAAIYFAVWCAFAYFLRKSSVAQDANGDEKLAHKRTNWSAPGLILFVVCLNFAMTDWMMSITPHWYSSIYGIWLMVNGALCAISLATFFVAKNADKEPYSGIVRPGLTKDLGNLMFVFTMLWAYTSLSQYLIIWSGNLTEFTPYYFVRSNNGWEYVGATSVIAGFVLPFLFLIAPKTKAYGGMLWKVAVWVLAIRVVDFFWIVIPTWRANPAFSWMDAAVFLGMGGLWFTVFSKNIGKANLIPTHDTRLPEVYEHA